MPCRQAPPGTLRPSQGPSCGGLRGMQTIVGVSLFSVSLVVTYRGALSFSFFFVHFGFSLSSFFPVGINPFSDMTFAEFKRRFLWLEPQVGVTAPWGQPHAPRQVHTRHSRRWGPRLSRRPEVRAPSALAASAPTMLNSGLPGNIQMPSENPISDQQQNILAQTLHGTDFHYTAASSPSTCTSDGTAEPSPY